MNSWYHNTKPDAQQGLIIEEHTGRTIAANTSTIHHGTVAVLLRPFKQE